MVDEVESESDAIDAPTFDLATTSTDTPYLPRSRGGKGKTAGSVSGSIIGAGEPKPRQPFWLRANASPSSLAGQVIGFAAPSREMDCPVPALQCVE